MSAEVKKKVLSHCEISTILYAQNRKPLQGSFQTKQCTEIILTTAGFTNKHDLSNVCWNIIAEKRQLLPW